MINIYNTLQRHKEELISKTPNQIKMYTCGQTVYNDIHIGNACFYVVFDTIRRYLEFKDYKVNFIQNFTDIDDKIIAKAQEENCTTQEIAERYIKRTLEDLVTLEVKPATTYAYATHEMPEIISMIQELIENGFAYENKGTVYYSVEKFPNYGKLSHKNIQDLKAGHRIEVEEGKANPMDFVLWKPAKENEPYWESPWGNGRPGWHIECSAMARKYLGDEIDIHGGAEDLIFPHHENEIAQTEAITGKPFARYWMHCGIITVDHKKMSKSRGNSVTFREVAKKFPPDVIRFYLLTMHYRMSKEFTDEVLTAAAAGLTRIKTCYNNLLHFLGQGSELDSFKNRNNRNFPNWLHSIKDSEHYVTINEIEPYLLTFYNAMDDDFNTADAITAIFELVKYINIQMAEEKIQTTKYAINLAIVLEHLMFDLLGIPLANKNTKSEIDEAQINALIEARQTARKNKDFAEADRIRNKLSSMGIKIEDIAGGGVRWNMQ